MTAGLGLLLRHRRILLATTAADIKGRYAGTVLGLAWTALYPLVFLALYAVVYTMIFRIRLGSGATMEYVLVIFAGLVPFLGFAEALGKGVGSVVSNKSLIKNTLFPVDLLPVKAVLSSSVTMLIGLCLLLGVLWGRGEFRASQLLVPLVVVMQLVFTIGVIWILAALNVFLRDLGLMVSVLILFLMLVSPIAYTVDMVPEELRPFMYLNPLYFLIELYRACLLNGAIPLPSMAVFATVGLSVFWAGHHVFSRLKDVFIEYV